MSRVSIYDHFLGVPLSNRKMPKRKSELDNLREWSWEEQKRKTKFGKLGSTSVELAGKLLSHYVSSFAHFDKDVIEPLRPLISLIDVPRAFDTEMAKVDEKSREKFSFPILAIRVLQPSEGKLALQLVCDKCKLEKECKDKVSHFEYIQLEYGQKVEAKSDILSRHLQFLESEPQVEKWVLCTPLKTRLEEEKVYGTQLDVYYYRFLQAYLNSTKNKKAVNEIILVTRIQGNTWRKMTPGECKVKKTNLLKLCQGNLEWFSQAKL